MAKRGSHQVRHNRTSKKGKIFGAGKIYMATEKRNISLKNLPPISAEKILKEGEVLEKFSEGNLIRYKGKKYFVDTEGRFAHKVK